MLIRGSDRPVRFRHRMLPRALAAAAHDEQVAVPHFVADPRVAAARPQRQRARRADRNDRDHGVLNGAATDRVAVPGDAVAAAEAVVQTGGADQQRRKPLVMRLTAGQCGDSPQFIAVLDELRVCPPSVPVGHGVRGQSVEENAEQDGESPNQFQLGP
jgi:hypothetical protein